MFGVVLINNSGVSATLMPNGDPVAGATRSISVDGFPFPLSLQDATNQEKTVPQSYAAKIFDGESTFQLGYEGTGTITVTISAGGAFSASSGYSQLISGQLVAAPSRLPAVQNLRWSPPNPVYSGTVMTVAWDPVSAAAGYDVVIERERQPTRLDQIVSGTSLTYTLKGTDMFGWLTATVVARGPDNLPSLKASERYYCGNNLG